jgi:hypothetical protein
VCRREKDGSRGNGGSVCAEWRSGIQKLNQGNATRELRGFTRETQRGIEKLKKGNATGN